MPQEVTWHRLKQNYDSSQKHKEENTKNNDAVKDFFQIGISEGKELLT